MPWGSLEVVAGVALGADQALRSWKRPGTCTPRLTLPRGTCWWQDHWASPQHPAGFL